MPRLIRRLSFGFMLVALALPAFSQTVMYTPDDEKAAEADSFMNAKLIAIERDHDRIQVRDNDGTKKTLALAHEATLPAGKVKAGTEVILAVRGRGSRQRVVSVKASEPAVRRVPLTNLRPLFIPGRGSAAES